ncbi:hypothetical protein [Dysosmobacter sp.]|uniref:hypothetical protein n=1 Tax=Dysosmobacter sp. TaxID=2591382 RepID=UPI002A85C732|nr:hypothetical protein [Dysosmobacter sp.]MDY3985132.1 hypothetical protein [Dysosmobacter sp.]
MRAEDIDELRPLTAVRLLELWRRCREETEDPLERAMLCNARVLAECCLRQGEPVFTDEGAVLAALTGRQMAELLGRLAEEEGPAEAVNPAFDWQRFRALGE